MIPMNMVLARPTQAFGRFQYETGKARQSSTGQMVIADADAFEASALVSGLPSFVSLLEAVARSTNNANLYVLAYDAPATAAVLQAILGGNGGAARQTFGPIAPGGVMVREFGEVFRGVASPFYTGMPFDSGVVLVASATPVIWTTPGINDVKLLARGTTKEGC